MFVDYHTHHKRCGHAVGAIEDYIIRGMEIGLHQLGVSDHMPLFHGKPSMHCTGLAMEKEELPRYVEEVLRLKEKYRGDIDILLGLEGYYVEGYDEEIAGLLEGYPWDYVIGSVHYLGDWDLFDSRECHNWQGQDAYAVHRAYYRAVRKAAESGFFDIIGHMDGIKRYGPSGIPGVWELQCEALDAISSAGIALELNTSGLRHPADTLYPNRHILEYCYGKGIPVTIGSDAHHPRYVAAGFDEASSLLQEAGFDSIAVFRNRRRALVPLTRLAALN